MIEMVGIDWEGTPAAEREECIKQVGSAESFVTRAKDVEGIRGCVLLKTCGRMETYLDVQDNAVGASRQIAAMMGGAALGKNGIHKKSDAACLRLMEIASGLRSQVLGEDQIISQVRTAIVNARESKTATPYLETLFRLAVTAGKEVRTRVRLRAVPTSCAHLAIDKLDSLIGPLSNKRALVIGNGEMGRIAAQLLIEHGCKVAMTLRTHHHGGTIVPKGCTTVSYDDRNAEMEGCDIVVSATLSPHVTVSAARVRELSSTPRAMVDLAMPRDIDPACGDLDGVLLLDIDDLVDERPKGDEADLSLAREIIYEKLDDYHSWESKRAQHLAEKLGAKNSGSGSVDHSDLGAIDGAVGDGIGDGAHGACAVDDGVGDGAHGTRDARATHGACDAHEDAVLDTRIAIFAGTTEGRLLCERLSAAGLTAEVFTATEYGGDLVSPILGMKVHSGRLDESEMENVLANIDIAIDATHPYAAQVSSNIRDACAVVDTRYIRLLRPSSAESKDEDGQLGDFVFVNSAKEAAEFLASVEGNVLLATGSKELPVYTSIPDFQKRIYPRVLPTADVVLRCHDLGFPASQLICMQGPFSKETNVALLKQIKASWMVTKDTGREGGFDEKIAAAKEAGARVVMITRPDPTEEGLSLEEVAELLIASRESSSGVDPFDSSSSLSSSSGSSPSSGSTSASSSPSPSSDSSSSTSSPEPSTSSPDPSDSCPSLASSSPDSTNPNPNSNPSSASDTVSSARFPMFFDLSNKRCLVVGGGKVGLRRAKALKDFGADVTILTKKFDGCDALDKCNKRDKHNKRDEQDKQEKHNEHNEHDEQIDNISVKIKEFEDKDLEGFDLVVAATDSHETNASVAKSCHGLGILVNVADDHNACDFYFPAICRSQNLVAGIASVKGDQHSLVVQAAKATRETLNRVDL